MDSIITEDDRCYICHRPASDIHHCVGGRFRKLSDKYGLTVPLCRSCHNNVHTSAKDALHLKQIAQKTFDEKYGAGEFMKVFGVNFLD